MAPLRGSSATTAPLRSPELRKPSSAAFCTACVDGQMDAAARDPGKLSSLLAQAALGVDEHAQAPVVAAQFGLEGGLQPDLPDARIDPIALALERPPAAGVHLPHIAQQMAGEAAERIVAPRLHDELHAGIDGLELREPEHRLARGRFSARRRAVSSRTACCKVSSSSSGSRPSSRASWPARKRRGPGSSAPSCGGCRSARRRAGWWPPACRCGRR